MSQNDLSLADQAGASFRADINAALQAIATQQSGATAPSTTYAYQRWADTTSNTLKQRNAANSAWLVRGTLAETMVISRSSNTILAEADRGKTLIATGSYTQTLTAAATLGDGWFIDVVVDSGVTLTLDPNGTEQIDGATTKAITGPAQGRIVCNGTLFRTLGFAEPVAVVQRAFAEYAANTDLTTTIPADDTIPQSSEGTEIISQSFTPLKSTSRIRIRAQGIMSGPNTAGGAIALFKDSTADAVAASIITFSTAAPTLPIVLEYEEAAGSTTARTYKLRAGGTSTVRMNGSTAGRYFGGVMKTTLIIEEIQ